MEKEACALCKKGHLHAKKIDKQLEIGDELYLAPGVEALVCDACGEVFYSADAMSGLEMAVAETIAREGAPSGPGFKYMRKVLGLRAADVAQAFGVTPETVSQWETSKREMPRLAFRVMARIVEDYVSGDSIAFAKEVRALERQRHSEPIIVGTSKKTAAGR